MRIDLRLLLLFVLAGVLASVNTEALANGQAGSCPEADARAAGASVDELRDWTAVAHFYDRFRRCDDGGTAEGVSDAIAKLLVREQPKVGVLVKLANSRRGMDAFVIRHLDGTLSEDDLRVIAEQLPKRCEPDAKHLCDAMARTASRALTNP